MVTEKYCPDCDRILAADNFYVKKWRWFAKKTGIEHNYTYLRSKCKLCHGREVEKNRALYIVNSIKKAELVSLINRLE